MASALGAEKFWVDKSRFGNAERQYYESLSKELMLARNNGEFIDEPQHVAVADNNGHCNELQAQGNGDVEASGKPGAKTVKAKKPKKPKSKKHHDSDSTADVVVVDTSTTVTPLLSANAEGDNVSCNGSAQPSEIGEVKASAKKSKKKSKSAASKKAAEIANVTTSPNRAGEQPQTLINNKRNSNASKLKGTTSNSQCTLVSEIAKAREHIKNSLEKMDGIATLAASPVSTEVLDRVVAVEKENCELRKLVENLKNLCLESQKRISTLEKQLNANATASKSAPAASVAKKAEPEDDDGVDLFGSDSEEESAEAARIREERLAAYAAKKSKKPVLIAKSSLVLDVKPWDDETDLKLMETEIRKIVADGLLWGASKFVPVAFGIQKLSISCVVEDDKISIDWLTEEIEKMEDYVQSVDVAAFNKI